MRLDRWLWAARLYKTRSLAAQAVDAGRVALNGARAKRATAVRVGDEVLVRRPPYEFRLVVRGLADRRLGAAAAAVLYEETPESREARERVRAQQRVLSTPRYEGKGRPTKRDRRALDRWRRERGAER